MRKPLFLLLIVGMIAALVTGCSLKTSPAPSAAPSAAATATPVPEEKPMEDIVSSVYTTVGEDTLIQAGGKDLKEKAYYDAEGRLLVPVKPVMEALGWKVEDSEENGDTLLKLTRKNDAGATGDLTPAEEMIQKAEEDAKVQTSPKAENAQDHEVTLRFAPPSAEEAARISNLVITKDGKDLKIAETLPWIDSTLYAHEEWLESVFEDLSIEYDGEKIISVTRQA